MQKIIYLSNKTSLSWLFRKRLGTILLVFRMLLYSQDCGTQTNIGKRQVNGFFGKSYSSSLDQI